MSLSAGDAFNEKVYEVTDEVTGVADRCMESHFEYGTKAAWWRIADTLERLGVPATVSTCGQAAELSPWLIEDAVKRGHEIACHGWRWYRERGKRGHEISCHGWRWEKHAHMEEAGAQAPVDAKVLTESRATVPSAGTHARRPRPTRAACWSRKAASSTTATTIPTTCPSSSRSSGKRHLVHALQLRHQRHALSTRASIASSRRATSPNTRSDAFDTLWAEGERQPKMMSIGLHLRMIGRPGRIAALDRIVQCT